MDGVQLIGLVLNAGNVALLVGIFYRLGGQGARLTNVENSVGRLWRRLDVKGDPV